jgi:hypothetical protein
MNLERMIIISIFLCGLGFTITIQNWNSLLKMPIKLRILRLIVLNLPFFMVLNLLWFYVKGMTLE